MRIAFLVAAGQGSGIQIYAENIKKALKKYKIYVDIDKTPSSKHSLINIQNPLPINLTKALSWLGKKPIVYTTHLTKRELKGLIPVYMIDYAESYLDIFYAACDKIICTSPIILEEIKVRGFSHKAACLTNAINTKEFKFSRVKRKRFREKYNLNKQTVLCVASIQERKGIFEFAKIAKKMRDYQFVWVGNIPNVPTLEKRKELEALIKQPPWENNIIFTGYLNRQQLTEAFSGADLFLLPSRSEVCSLAILEAASAGLPVIVRDIPQHKIFDFAVLYKSEKKLQKIIFRIFSNSRYRQKLKRSALKSSNDYSIDVYVKKLSKIYFELLKEFELTKKDYFNIRFRRSLARRRKSLEKLLTHGKIDITKLRSELRTRAVLLEISTRQAQYAFIEAFDNFFKKYNKLNFKYRHKQFVRVFEKIFNHAMEKQESLAKIIRKIRLF